MNNFTQLIIAYFCRFIKNWAFWFWSPIIDILTLLADRNFTNLDIPIEVYWSIPVVGFIIANIKNSISYHKQSAKIMTHQ